MEGLDPQFITAAVASGVLVGFVLGLIGGGGSILAVPLFMYVVGVGEPHVAIGTAAIAVAANAAWSLIAHARAGNVLWNCAAVFAAAGVFGAWAGSTVGKAINGQALLAAFGMLMIAVGGLMLRPRASAGDADVRLTRDTARKLLPRLAPIGFGAGALSGFFGIGGGFLIAPGLMAATNMPLRLAVGSSLVGVTAFGLTTAANYAASGLVHWSAAGLAIGGGVLGAFFGQKASARLADTKRALTYVFSGVVIVVGLFVTARGLLAL